MFIGCCSRGQRYTAATAVSSLEALNRDGITALKGAFSREWADAMREDMMTAFWAAIQRPGGAIGRGPRRWYVEVHPEQVSGFVALVTHPWVTAMSEAALGPDYEIVEIGFDVPFQGAKKGAGHSALHDPMVTPAFWESLPPSVKDHLVCRVVDELVPIAQKHDIEGLEMGTE